MCIEQKKEADASKNPWETNGNYFRSSHFFTLHVLQWPRPLIENEDKNKIDGWNAYAYDYEIWYRQKTGAQSRIFTCPKKGERSSLGRNAINLLLVVGNDTQVYQCVRSIRFDEFGEGDMIGM